MRLSAIIVSYNVKDYIVQCVRSLYDAVTDFELEVFVVDNNSVDGTPDFLRKEFLQTEFPLFHLIENPVNVGFGKANNIALHQSTGDYVLFINPDTIVTKHCLSDCLDFFSQHPEAGGLGVRMLKPNGAFAPESRRGLPTPFTSLCKILGLSKLFPKSRVFGKYYLQYLDDRDVCCIDVISGAFMMIPKPVLDKVGGFDEKFFMYGEDIDLSYRIQKEGYQNYYLPTPILHYKGESTEKTSYKYVYVFYEAMLIFFNKHYHHTSFLLSIPIKLAILLFGIKSLLQQKLGQLRLKAHAWSDVPVRKYLFIGSHEMLEQARQLCERWMLDADFIEGTEATLPEGHVGLEGEACSYRFVCYDRQSFSVATILAHFERSKEKQSYMGMYYPDRQMLITNQNIFKL